MLGTWNISNWQWSCSLKFNPEASFPWQNIYWMSRWQASKWKPYISKSIHCRNIRCAPQQRKTPDFIPNSLIDFNVGNPAGMTIIQTMFDTSPCVLKEVVGYRSEGVTYANFPILKFFVFYHVIETRNHGNYTIPGGWITLGHQPEQRWIPFCGDMWRTSSTRSKITLSSFKCPNKLRCGYRNAHHASKHVDLSPLHRLDISRATRVAHIEKY